MAIKLKKGDKAMVIAGKNKGKVGVIERVLVKTAQILIPGGNTIKKHVKVSKKYPAGGIVEIEKPIDSSKVALVCPNCGKPTRIGYSIDKSKQKNRICKKCGKVVTVAKDKKEK